jgi:glycerol-3-phosphate dehydrogenase
VKRDLDALAGRTFDLLVIGGGVIGVAVARDAARRGLKVALVERDDFCCAASEAMSHLIHGGIRYLAQGHFRQVFQSLSERRIWCKVAPEHVVAQPFLLPLIAKPAAERLALAAGAALFELLGGNGIGRRLTPKEAVAAEPVLENRELAGAITYSDCRLDRPEHLVLAMLADAAAHGLVAANHAEATALTKVAGGLRVHVKDRCSGSGLQVEALAVANVTGPWSAQLASKFVPGQKAARLIASKGIHIVTRRFGGVHAIALSGRGEHGFIAPWGGFSLIGTTDDPIEPSASLPAATDKEIASLSARIARLLPAAATHVSEPLASFAGIRALPGAQADTYSASRDFTVADHAGDGFAGFYSVYGGKWTTARLVAERAVDRIAGQFTRDLAPCDTSTAVIAPLPQAALGDFMVATPQDAARRQSRLSRLEHLLRS